MFNKNDEKIKSCMLEGEFGLELESLRVTPSGHMAHSPHPFAGDRNIVRDFSENQVEINTSPHDSAEGVLEELLGHVDRVRRTISELPEAELLWPFSNPAILLNEEDIHIAQYYGEMRSSTEYREYLSEKYGRYLMTYSGIHFNYSFREEFLKEIFKSSGQLTGAASSAIEKEGACRDEYRLFKNRFYLELAEKLVAYGWLVCALLAASPVCDGSLFNEEEQGETLVTEYSSIRCSELGYWNDFDPVLNYDSVEAYADSMRKYIEDGTLIAERELYYPVRLKPRGPYSMETLEQKGINHIELRMIDLNPLVSVGLDIRDLKFLQLLLIWLASLERVKLSAEDQVDAVRNFKTSGHYDIDEEIIVGKGLRSAAKGVPEGGKPEATIRSAALEILSEMMEFFDGEEEKELVDFQMQKLDGRGHRYCEQMVALFGEDYISRGLELAEERLKNLRVVV